MPDTYPDCTFYHMAQRTDEWYAARKGVLTASSAGAWLADQPKIALTIPEIKAELTAAKVGFSKTAKRDELIELLPNPKKYLEESKGTISARETAIFSVLGGMTNCPVPEPFAVDPLGDPPRNPASWAVWNGLRLEEEATEHFEKETGNKVSEVGFARSKYGAFGCSPDGLIRKENSGFEGKAPLPQTHIKYLLKGELPEEYKIQVHSSMAVTGASSWWFQSYCPGLPPLVIKVERDNYTEAVFSGLKKFDEELSACRARIAEMWDAANTKPKQK